MRVHFQYGWVLTEGKNREIRKLLEHFGPIANRLMWVQYCHFALNDLVIGTVKDVLPAKVKAFAEHLAARAVDL